jgi:hypothetical protein
MIQLRNHAGRILAVMALASLILSPGFAAKRKPFAKVRGCVGADPCKACTSCVRCALCHYHGGTCGACRKPGRKPAPKVARR